MKFQQSYKLNRKCVKEKETIDVNLTSHEIHAVLDPLFHQFLDFQLLVLGQVVASAARHRPLLEAGELVVVLPGPVRHQVGVVGGGGVGNSPGAPE